MTSFLVALALSNPVAEFKDTVRAKISQCGYSCRIARIVRPYNAKLNRMAYCESSGRWFLNSGNGYYGGLQFDLRTWRSVGGHSYPHLNSVLEQKYRAVLLIRRRGYSPWPRCGYA